MNEDYPTVGRIVHYVSYGTPGGEFVPEHRAAIVTEVNVLPDDRVVASLCVLNPSGMFFNQNLAQDEDTKAGGTWHWPERV